MNKCTTYYYLLGYINYIFVHILKTALTCKLACKIFEKGDWRELVINNVSFELVTLYSDTPWLRIGASNLRINEDITFSNKGNFQIYLCSL